MTALDPNRAADATAPLDDRVEAALGSRPLACRRLAGASTVAVLALDLADGRTVVAKHADGDGRADLPIEKAMLEDLARESALPLPTVLYGCDDLLLMSHIENDGGAPGAAAQAHAAELLADLHSRRFDRFGWHRDTVIGQLPQPNPWTDGWVGLLPRTHRLLHMAEAGRREGTVDGRLYDRLEALAGRIERYVAEPPHPALLHGDIWTGNVLTRGDRIAGFIDPAIYVGHPEIELAFATPVRHLRRPVLPPLCRAGAVRAGFLRAAARPLQHLSAAGARPVLEPGLRPPDRADAGSDRPVGDRARSGRGGPRPSPDGSARPEIAADGSAGGCRPPGPGARVRTGGKHPPDLAGPSGPALLRHRPSAIRP